MKQPAIDLTIDQVDSANRPGSYILQGKAVLPEETPLTISAVRFLIPDADSDQPDASAARFSILDRKTARVKDGLWQAELNLWQVAPDGQYQESWQMTLQDDIDFKPAPTVTFLATLEPTEFTQRLQQQLEAANPDEASPLQAISPDGELYLRVQQVVAVTLPEGSTSAPLPAATDLSQLWQDRRASNPSANITPLPEVPFETGDNLPLSEDHRLQ